MAQFPLTFQLGSFSCIILSDGFISRPADNLFPTIDEHLLRQACADYNIPFDSFPIPFHFLYVDTGKDKILIDTGRGIQTGQLLPQLRTVGISQDSIDYVILSHAHSDHIGACSTEEGDPIFPNAKYLIHKKEWEYWYQLAETDKGSTLFMQQLGSLEKQVSFIHEETEIIPGIIAISASGHSPGHMVLLIRSGGDKLLHGADLMHHPIQLVHPDWATRFDMNQEAASQTRIRIMEWAIEQGCWYFFTHYPSPAIGKVKEVNSEWTWIPQKLKGQ